MQRGRRHSPSAASLFLRNDVVVHRTRDVGQAEVAAGVAVGEPFVVDAHQVQDGGVQIVDVHASLRGGETELVGGAVNVASLDAAAGEPNGEPVIVVIAPARPF